MLITIQNL